MIGGKMIGHRPISTSQHHPGAQRRQLRTGAIEAEQGQRGHGGRKPGKGMNLATSPQNECENRRRRPSRGLAHTPGTPIFALFRWTSERAASIRCPDGGSGQGSFASFLKGPLPPSGHRIERGTIDLQSDINCLPERSLLGAFGKQHDDYDHDVFNSAGSTLATPHFGPENGVHLKANAALRSIVRRDTGESYESYLKELARKSGIEEPSRADIAKLDKKRPKKGSNKEWVNPNEPDAEIMKMKSGGTDMAHKAEHAVDMSGEGAVIAVTLHGGAKGDTKSLPDTLEKAQSNLQELANNAECCERIHEDAGREVVGDKGYHGNDILVELVEQEYRSYISEPERGGRKWKDKQAEQAATYANRRRIRGTRGKRLIRRRGELLERPFAHYLEAGGMRRTHLRRHENILKRLLTHVAGFNLGILMRNLIGKATPKEYAELKASLIAALLRFVSTIGERFAPAAIHRASQLGRSAESHLP